MVWKWNQDSVVAWLSTPVSADSPSASDLPWWQSETVGIAVISFLAALSGAGLTAFFHLRNAEKQRQADREAFWVERRLESATLILRTGWSIGVACNRIAPLTPTEIQAVKDDQSTLVHEANQAALLFEGDVHIAVHDLVSPSITLLGEKIRKDRGVSHDFGGWQDKQQSALSTVTVRLQQEFRDGTLFIPGLTHHRHHRFHRHTRLHHLRHHLTDLWKRIF